MNKFFVVLHCSLRVQWFVRYFFFSIFLFFEFSDRMFVLHSQFLWHEQRQKENHWILRFIFASKCSAGYEIYRNKWRNYFGIRLIFLSKKVLRNLQKFCIKNDFPVIDFNCDSADGLLWDYLTVIHFFFSNRIRFEARIKKIWK